MKREALGFGFSKILGNGFDVQVRVRNEEKDGARIFSRGTATSAFEFAPEPLNSTTRQLEAILGYTDRKLQVQGSYYGTSYNNHNTSLNFTGGTAALAAFNSIGLPPDSESHQLSLGGGYSFTPTTRGTFKLAYTRATQTDTFIAGVPVMAGISPTGNLGGRVDTTLVQLGLSARPDPKLSLIGDLRQEDRNDKTPIRLYTTNGVTPISSFNGENEPRSIRTTTGKLEASYRLPMAMRVTGGIDYVEKERNTSAIRVVSFRERTEETSYRVMLSRSMTDTVTGSIAYIRSIRNGSDFLTTVLNCGAVTCTSAGTTATALNLIAPLHLADRERDKVKLSISWTPLEALSLQFAADQTRDDYGSRTADEFGLRDGMSKNFSFDASYAFSDEWQANGWISKNDTLANRADRTTPTNPWASSLLNNAWAYGLGVRGKPSARWDIGIDLSHSDIVDAYRQWALAGPAVAPLPDVFTRQSTARLFGIYALDKNSSIRFDYVYDRFSTNDWTWASWTYSDGTFLSQKPTQNVNFIGVTYIYRFR
jgi:MtrB/PioB family decaheme-associated outer membrane protein